MSHGAGLYGTPRFLGALTLAVTMLFLAIPAIERGLARAWERAWLAWAVWRIRRDRREKRPFCDIGHIP